MMRRAAGAAELLRDLDAHESELEELGDERGIDSRRAFHLLHARADFLLRERGDRVAKGTLLFGERGERARRRRAVDIHGRNVMPSQRELLSASGSTGVTPARSSTTAASWSFTPNAGVTCTEIAG